MGAWIETTGLLYLLNCLLVAPLVGAWIETFTPAQFKDSAVSHPSWVRGLKLLNEPLLGLTQVAPLVGAWIETGYKFKKNIVNGGRTPRGCVD